jgi:peptidyl-prolyl cis-trans isomerase A (cyclophilin A)
VHSSWLNNLSVRFVLACLLLTGIPGCVADPDPETPPPPLEIEEADDTSADGEVTFVVRFDTSEGEFLVEIHPDWAPEGAERFRHLVESGFFKDCRFFRVVPGFMAQFGINGDPAKNKQWDTNIPPDRVRKSNVRGMLTYAMAGSPDTRSTQLFINYGDNSFLDQQGFAPIGKVIEGMAVVDALYGEYGDGPPQGNGPDQGRIQAEGNAYLVREFPKLDYIKSATIINLLDQPRDKAEEATPRLETAPAEATPAATEPPSTETPAAKTEPAAETEAQPAPAAEKPAESAPQEASPAAETESAPQ